MGKDGAQKMSEHSAFAIVDVRCRIKNDSQKKLIMEKSAGDTIVVKGKIKDVGELMGYSLDMDEVK